MSFIIAAKLSSATNSFVGAISWNDLGVFSGTINGWLYGPAGQKVGAVFSATQLDAVTIAVGTIISRGSAPTAEDTTQSGPATNGFLFADTAGFRVSQTGVDGSNAPGGTYNGSFSNGNTTSGKQNSIQMRSGGYTSTAGAMLPTGQMFVIGTGSSGTEQSESCSSSGRRSPGHSPC